MGNRDRLRTFFKLKNCSKKLAICRVSDLMKHWPNLDNLANEFARIDRDVWAVITQDSRFSKTKEIAKSHFKICPQITYCAFEDGKLVATLTNMFTTEVDLAKNKTWTEKTGNGYLTTHLSNGDVGFGVDLAVTKEASKKVSGRLVLTAILIGVLGEGLKGVWLGARIPSYHKHKNMKVEDYVYGTRKNGKPLDPELYFYMKDGFEIMEIIPEYMDDPDSLNYGVLVRWSNPLYKVTKTLPFLKPMIRWIGKKIFLRIPKDAKALMRQPA